MTLKQTVSYDLEDTRYNIQLHELTQDYDITIMNQTITYVVEYFSKLLFMDYDKFHSKVLVNFIQFIVNNKLKSDNLVSVLYKAETHEHSFHVDFNKLINQLIKDKLGVNAHIENAHTPNFQTTKPFFCNIFVSDCDEPSDFEHTLKYMIFNGLTNFKTVEELRINEVDYTQQKDQLSCMLEFLYSNLDFSIGDEGESFYIFLTLRNISFDDLLESYEQLFREYQKSYIGHSDLQKIAFSYIDVMERNGIKILHNPSNNMAEWFLTEVFNQNKAICINSTHYFIVN